MVMEFLPAAIALAISFAFLGTVIRLSHRW
jgi:hypothetical protein